MTLPVLQRILVVDDDHDMHGTFAPLLSAEGYRVVHAIDGQDAIFLHQQHAFDLAIVELFGAGYNGFEAFAGLRRVPSPPRFIVTAKAGRTPADAYLKVAKQLGAHETLAKPFLTDQFVVAVRNVLRHHRQV